MGSVSKRRVWEKNRHSLSLKEKRNQFYYIGKKEKLQGFGQKFHCSSLASGTVKKTAVDRCFFAMVR
jgi:hypothetical protein